MEGIREYLISVTAAALLCGILRSLTGEKGSVNGLLRLVSGIFLALTVIRPVKELTLGEFSFLPSDLLTEARAASEEGADYAQRAMERLIKEQCEAYILDKAQALGADIQVDIRVSGDSTPVPISSVVSGDLSPYAKSQLKQALETDLGIPEEDQQWTP